MKIADFSMNLRAEDNHSGMQSLSRLANASLEQLTAKGLPEFLGWVPWPKADESVLSLI